MRTVLIVDGSNVAYRARHAYNLSYRGVDTSVVYGFLRILWSELGLRDCDAVVVCWDGGTPGHRLEACPGYKQHRDHSDDPEYPDFIRQVRELQSLLPMLGVCSVRRRFVEADDLMYHAACLLCGNELFVLTTDSDLYQAVLTIPDVTVVSGDLIVTRQNFENVTEVRSDWMTWMTYRCMVGDSSDGLVGVPGIGHKRAIEILKQYGNNPVSIVNAASGHGPKSMVGANADRISAFGIDGFRRMFRTIRLDKDLCGARSALLREFERWRPVEAEEVREYLHSYALVSLMEPAFYRSFACLVGPMECVGNLSELRVPKIVSVRKAM